MNVSICITYYYTARAEMNLVLHFGLGLTLSAYSLLNVDNCSDQITV